MSPIERINLLAFWSELYFNSVIYWLKHRHNEYIKHKIYYYGQMMSLYGMPETDY